MPNQCDMSSLDVSFTPSSMSVILELGKHIPLRKDMLCLQGVSVERAGVNKILYYKSTDFGRQCKVHINLKKRNCRNGTFIVTQCMPCAYSLLLEYFKGRVCQAPFTYTL